MVSMACVLAFDKGLFLDYFLRHSPHPALALPCRILMAQKVLGHWQLACVQGVRMLHGSVFKCVLNLHPR